MSGLPATIDPILLAERGARLDGQLPLKPMTRLLADAKAGKREIGVSLEFRRAEGGNFYELTGQLETMLEMTCQRCLQVMEIAVVAEPRLVLVRPGSPEAPPEADVMVVEGPVSLAQVVEDELILAMPMYPVHPDGQCPSAKVSAPTPERENPFAILKQKGIGTRK